jgi:hypothetical protein
MAWLPLPILNPGLEISMELPQRHGGNKLPRTSENGHHAEANQGKPLHAVDLRGLKFIFWGMEGIYRKRNCVSRKFSENFQVVN